MSLTLRLNASESGFDDALANRLRVPVEDRDTVRQVVRDIIEEVRRDGDRALVSLTNRFDRRQVREIAELEISPETMASAVDRIDALVKDALVTSINRVRAYHEQQKRALGDQVDWNYRDADGNELGQQVRGMERVGIYVPGGKASYPSSVIMTAVPARVAEVGEIILVVPTPDDEVSDVLIAAASLCGVDRMFTIGGAQAVAALAYGTSSVPRVDKIVGPGNIYVATAKELVFGDVGIDMIAGPSEVVIIADKHARPDWLAMDLFAQAEHDELAQAILISDSPELLAEVYRQMENALPGMNRKGIITASMGGRGALIEVADLEQAVAVANRIAPEHLELAVEAPDALLPGIRHAGAIFLGGHSAEAMGDYCAGPSHVLPTSGSARFSSPLGVYDFQVRRSLIRVSARGAIGLGRTAAILATEEGLEAHARSAELRVEG